METELERREFIDQTFWSGMRILFTILLITIIDAFISDKNPNFITMWNLIILAIMDGLDSIPMQFVYGKRYVKKWLYQSQDKVSDTALGFYVLIVHLSMIKEVTPFDIIFTGLFFYRATGVLLYEYTQDGIYLAIFPNFYVDLTLVYLILTEIFRAPTAIVAGITGLAAPLLVAKEYIHHTIVVP